MKLEFGDRSLWEVGFPAKPKVGPPVHADAVEHRDCEETYHWKIWGSDQLRAYEQYWDEVVGLLARFLPDDIQQRMQELEGVNLGTGTGCYQKAWERLGFRMYGLEREDNLIPYLHEYGCAGERANFFRMPQFADGRWDFAVLDRAMLGQEGVYQRVHIDGAGSNDFHDREYGDFTIPPYAREVMRVLRPDGVLLTVLLPFWTEDLVQELAGYGRLTLTPAAPEKPHPFLVALVERGHPATQVTPRRDFHEGALSRTGELSAAELAARLADDPNCALVRPKGESVRFLHVPSNHLVSYDKSSAGWEVGEDRYWTDVPWRFERWAPEARTSAFSAVARLARRALRPHGGVRPQHAQLIRQTEKAARSGQPVVMVLGDAVHVSRNGRDGFAGELYESLGSEFNFVHVPHYCGRSQEVLNNIEEWIADAPDVVVLMIGRDDAWTSVTRAFAPKRVRNHARAIEDVVRLIKAQGPRVVWVPHVRVREEDAVRRMEDGTITHRLTNDALEAFSGAVLETIDGEVDEIVDLNAVLGGDGEDPLGPDGLTLAPHAAAAAIAAIGDALRRVSVAARG